MGIPHVMQSKSVQSICCISTEDYMLSVYSVGSLSEFCHILNSRNLKIYSKPNICILIILWMFVYSVSSLSEFCMSQSYFDQMKFLNFFKA